MELKKKTDEFEDFPLSEVPLSSRKGFWSLSVVLLGFTFFSSTMWAGGSIGLGLKFFPDLIFVTLAGNILLGIYAAILGNIAYKSGLNTVLMSRFSLGEYGSKLSDILLGVTQICWYAWGTATIAIISIKMLGIPEWTSPYLMIFFGLLFCVTAFVGYKGLERLSIIAVPLMTVLIFISLAIAFIKSKELGGVLSLIPSKELSMCTGITLVFGTFVSGGTQATNWSRFAKSSESAIWASMAAFFIGNGLMIFVGAIGALVYKESEISEVLKLQGLFWFGLIMLFLNIWTTQDNTIYNFSVAGCNFFRTEKRRLITIIGAVVGIILAFMGMYEWLIPYLVLLGTFIPPLGGIIMADFYIAKKMSYPALSSITAKFNIIGIIAYSIGAISAFYIHFIPPITGIITSFITYSVLFYLNRKYKLVKI